MTTQTLAGSGRFRIVSSAIFLFISYFHATTTVSGIPLNSQKTGLSAPGEEPFTAAESSSLNAGVPVYPCAQSAERRGCPVETERPRRSVGRTRHVRDKRSGGAADDPVHEYPDWLTESGVQSREGLLRPGNIHGHPNGNKLTWNVPFRMMYRSEKRRIKFGKRFSSNDLDDDLDKSSTTGSGDRVPTKFGGRRRKKNADSGIGPEETVPDTEQKKSVVFVETKNPDSERKWNGNAEIGRKRKFKFGKKKSDPEEEMEEEEEVEDGGEIRDEEKRQILFGKRGSGFHDADESLEDSPGPVEAKRRRKFHFG